MPASNCCACNPGAAPAIEEKTRRNPWRPNAGIYALAGADFSERCLNGGETVIDLGERLVSSRNDKCSVIQIRDAGIGRSLVGPRGIRGSGLSTGLGIPRLSSEKLSCKGPSNPLRRQPFCLPQQLPEEKFPHQLSPQNFRNNIGRSARDARQMLAGVHSIKDQRKKFRQQPEPTG
jgi:hypothetical protein